MRIPYTASARLAKLIGKENFSNAEGALVELIKNSYDADSNECYVVFAHKENLPILYIVDFGCGMNLETIKDKWMKLATDDKLYNFKSAKGRVKSGAKGIGRFALNRLGHKSEMLTCTKDGEGIRWTMNWDDFDVPQAELSEVSAEAVPVNLLTIQENVAQIVSPFIEDYEKETFLHGTLLKITLLNDSWNEERITSFYDNLSHLLPPYARGTFKLGLFSDIDTTKYGIVEMTDYTDYDYYVKATYTEGNLKVTIDRNELNVADLERMYGKIFARKDMLRFPFTLQAFKDKTFVLNKKLSDLSLESKTRLEEHENELGPFEFEFYFLKNTISDNKSEGDKKKFPYRSFVSANRKAWLEQNAGVKIYRDGFRVRPYGERGEDWLKLGERQAKSPGGAGQRLGGYRIRPNQISGAVSISRIDNPALEDKSGREGMQESVVFEMFKDILIGIINIFEDDRNRVMFALSDEYRKTSEKHISDADGVLKKTEPLDEQDVKKLKKGYEAIKSELRHKDSEMDLLRNLASTGLAVASSAHELSNISGILTTRGLNLGKALEEILPREHVESLGIIKYKNPFFMIDTIAKDDLEINGWLSFALTSVKAEKRAEADVELNAFFTDYIEKWKPILSPANIRLTLDKEFPVCMVRITPIDLDSLFNNFLSNSVYAIQKLMSKERRDIKICGVLTDDEIAISFVDNGIGLAQEYVSRPYDIFNSFETSKCDKYGNKIGTGLGLYIVKSIIEKYKDAKISILDNVLEGFGIQITLKTINNEI